MNHKTATDPCANQPPACVYLMHQADASRTDRAGWLRNPMTVELTVS
jgi:hypothetical protein